MIVVGWDLATRRCGWCAGSIEGTELPTADAILLPHVGGDIGRMLKLFEQRVRLIHQRFPADVWVFEAPIITKRDLGQLDVVRKLYAIAGFLEWLGPELRVDVEEAGIAALKRELAGFSKAQKEDMVAAAQKVGITLPETKEAGQQDAADAFAAWLCGMRAYARRDVRDFWDRRLHSPRGMLL